MDVDAISLDNIGILSKWRVEIEMPIMEEAPTWLEPEEQQHEEREEESKEEEREEEQVGDMMECDVLASTPPFTPIDVACPTLVSRCIRSRAMAF